MTKTAKDNDELTTKDGLNGAYSRFEPIKKLLVRCDEKTLAYAPTTSSLAA